MSRKMKYFLLTGLFGLLALGGNGSFAACTELADYPDFDCSFPYFSQGVDVSIKHAKGEVPEGAIGNRIKKFKATYRESSASSLLFAPDDVYEISHFTLLRPKYYWMNLLLESLNLIDRSFDATVVASNR